MAYVRLLRFEELSSGVGQSALGTLDKPFTGSIPQQIRNIRAYFRESGFFKKYQKRNPAGGFTEDAEFPLVAIDEAIVNAVAHREYAVKLPIDCKKFSDAFTVENPGRVLQHERDVPKDFSLAEITLEHVPRNPKLLNWLKMMKDESGAEFVRALSEGTRRMRDEMQKMSLPAPRFHVTPFKTHVTLFNNAAEREALLRSSESTDQRSTEFTNLFPLKLTDVRALSVNELGRLRKDIALALRTSLQGHGWFLDRTGFRIRAHKRGTELHLPKEVTKFLRFYPAYSFQVREYWTLLYLAIDYALEVKNVCNISELLKYLTAEMLVGKTTVAYWQGWHQGRIQSINSEWTEVLFFEFDRVETVSSDKVIPNLPTGILEMLLSKNAIRFDLSKAIKQSSLASEQNASRTRAAKSQATADELSRSAFPLIASDISVSLQPTSTSISRNSELVSALQAVGIVEPVVEFHHQQESQDIREGITRFGAYDTEQHGIELVPVCTVDKREQMAALIQRFKSGTTSLLVGLVWDSNGTQFTPSHTLKNGRRYRYYVGRTNKDNSQQSPDKTPEKPTRIAAQELEKLVCLRLQSFLRSPRNVLDEVGGTRDIPANLQQILAKAMALSEHCLSLRAEERGFVRDVVRRIVVNSNKIEVQLSRKQLGGLLCQPDSGNLGDRNSRFGQPTHISNDKEPQSDIIRLEIDAQVKRCGIEIRLVVAPKDQDHIESNIVPSLLKAIARAYRWSEWIASGEVSTLGGIARRLGINKRYVALVYSCAFLAPDIIEAILDGRQPADVSFQRLTRPLPVNWNSQKRILGFKS